MARKTNQNGNFSATKKTIKPVSYSTDGEKIVWMFDKIDRNGSFAFDIHRSDFRSDIIMEKLIDYSSMTWDEIKKQTHDKGKSKHHLLSIDSLSKDAFERLKAKQLEEESDSIFSFALQNKLRVVGIREGRYFHVIWYDPEHRICPATKKNT